MSLDIGKGDVIDIVRRVRVAELADDGKTVITEPHGDRFWLEHDSVQDVRMVVKARRKVKVGDVISDAELRERTWRHGTTLKNASGSGSWIFVLDKLGRWHASDGETFEFEDMSSGDVTDPWTYKIVYLP